MEWKSNVKYGVDPKLGSIFDCKEVNSDLVIHKYSGCGDNLYLTCNALGISCVSLRTENFDEAVRISKEIVNEQIKFLYRKFEKFIKDDTENIIVRY